MLSVCSVWITDNPPLLSLSLPQHPSSLLLFLLLSHLQPLSPDVALLYLLFSCYSSCHALVKFPLFPHNSCHVFPPVSIPNAWLVFPTHLPPICFPTPFICLFLSSFIFPLSSLSPLRHNLLLCLCPLLWQSAVIEISCGSGSLDYIRCSWDRGQANSL